MIKILKHGSFVRRVMTYRVICKNCFCEFTCDENDTIPSTSELYSNSIICPDCGRRYHVDDESVVTCELQEQTFEGSGQYYAGETTHA